MDRRLPPLGRIAAAGMRGPAVPPIQRTCPAARVARLAGLSGNAAERGWDYRGVLLSLVCRLLRCLFSLLAVLVRSGLSNDAELLVLRHQNQVLRR